MTVLVPPSRSSLSAWSRASSQESFSKRRGPAFRSGSAIRSSACRWPNANRPLSQSQPSSISGWFRDWMRLTLPSRVVALMLQPTGQRPHTVGTFWISHGRATKR